jgi:WD40 repeat protein
MKSGIHARHRVVLTKVLTGLIACVIALSASLGSAIAQTSSPSWTYTGNLNVRRGEHTATLLPNGKVLVAGGGSDGLLSSAELYDPATGTWSPTGSLNGPRTRHTATLLPNGKVLVAGGDVTNTAELYDPATGTWSPTGNMNAPRAWHSATLLGNGKVLIVGGYDSEGYGSAWSHGLNTAELYDPETGVWSITGSLNQGRLAHTATLLQSGKVLVVGGTDSIYDAFTVDEEYNGGLVSAELYDPTSGSWTVVGNLNTGRLLHSATLLLDGSVLVAGGGSSPDGLLINMPNTSELYSPATGTWSYTGTLSARVYHTATLLRNGQVLVAGGGVYQAILNTAEVYDPATGNWHDTASLQLPRYLHTATLLYNGKVLVVGGRGDRSAELYDSGLISTPNAIDDAQFFVRQQYLDFLGREPDLSGFAFWTNEIASCGADQQCIDVKRVNVSAAFFLSIEFQQTGYLVYRMYKAAYGNLTDAPVPVKFNVFMADAQEIGHEVVVLQPGWETVLENNKQAFADEFVNRPQFISAYPSSMSAADFVDALNVNAGNVLTQTERDRLVSDLSSGAQTRAQVLRAVAENPQLITNEFNRTFVLMQYFGYLRRDPNSGPDTDFTGYNFWLNKLNQFNGNYLDAEMVKAFITSSEYRQRFRH